MSEEPAELVPVDPPEQPKTIYGTALAVREAEKRPIVPAWARNRDEARQLAGWLAKYGTHVTLYHLTRLPKYAAKLAMRAPVGVLVALAGVVAWVFDREATPLRADAVHRGSVDDYMKLSKQRNERVKRRLTVAAGGALVLVVATVWATVWAPWWGEWLYVAVWVAVLGKLGTPADRRVTDVATVNTAAPPRLTAEVVTRALRVLGIAAMNAKGAEITYPAPIMQSGPGWLAIVDLPYGVTPQDVMEKRRELASGLRRPLGCVWPEPASAAHAGRLHLWVGFEDLSKTKQPPWPLARTGRADLFSPVPFGTDQRGRLVSVTLMFASMVIGSIPRMGKTFSLRLLLLAAALDPRAELHLYDLKGTGDLSPLAPVAHAYRAGEEDDDLEYGLADMRALHEELRRRARVIRDLPRNLCPENKVTPELAAQRQLGLHPIVLGVDECQKWFESAHGKDFEAIAEDLVRRGPALGIIPIFATQRPDSKSLPTGISGNAVLRFCLKVMGHTENDMVLGTSAHKNGIKATIFTRRDLGIGYLAGEDDDPQITRTFYVDSPSAEAIAARARAAREAAGTLSGYALGEETPLTPAASLLDDLRVVFATITVEKVWSETVVEKLAELRPEVYGRMTPEALTAALKPYGISTGHQVWGRLADGTGANRRGLLRAEVLAAIERREISR